MSKSVSELISEPMTKSVLITGATGFVGKRVCEYFLAKGLKVIGCGRQARVNLQHPNFEYHSFDLSEIKRYGYLLETVDIVVHLAALAHQSKRLNPLTYYQVNADCSKQLISICAQYNIQRFVYISTIKVNGERSIDVPFNEQHTPNPLDVYGRSKWFAENYVQDIAMDANMEWVIIRPPLVYGPGAKANFASLMKLIDMHLPVPFAAFLSKRSFIAIDNLCDFIFTCAFHVNAKNQIFCISDDDDQSTRTLIKTLQVVRMGREKLFNCPIILLKMACILLGRRAIFNRLSDPLQVDIAKAKQLLEWKPVLTFKEAIFKYFGVEKKSKEMT